MFLVVSGHSIVGWIITAGRQQGLREVRQEVGNGAGIGSQEFEDSQPWFHRACRHRLGMSELFALGRDCRTGKVISI